MQFRKLVVALAVSGRLNAPEKMMQPSEVREAIELAKVSLTKQGLRPAQSKSSVVTREQLPEAFSDPSRFARLGSLARIEKGKTGIKQAKAGQFPLVVTASERSTSVHYDFEGAAAIIPLVSSTGHGNASLNRLHYQEGRFALGTILIAVFPHDPDLMSARFIFEYLSAFKDELLVSRMTGTANVTLSVGSISEVPVPLVCPIVQKQVDELMALCDQLDAARLKREAARDRLAASSLARLNTPTPETFANDARFALSALPSLTTRPDQIKQLRQTILNLAVRGKLVPQDARDEPALELLRLVAKEIAAYSHASRISEIRPDPIADDELPFGAPIGWQWTRLCTLFNVITDGDHQSPPRAEKGVAFLTIGNITTGQLDFTNCRNVPESYFRSLQPYRTPSKGDILYTVVGATYGRPAVVETDREFCVQRHVAILKPPGALSLRYLAYLLGSPLVYEQASSSTTGTAQPTIALRPLRNFLVPLPPLAEQHRIVAKVDELMALCDQLEVSLDTAAATRRRLLDALLAEALAPALEAA